MGSTTKNTPRLRVAISGGGIGGLVLAVALSKYPDIEVTIYEAASKLTQVGAGVGLFPRPWEIIRKLDLEDDLLKKTEVKRQEGPVRTFVYRKSDCSEGLDFYTLITEGNLMAFHRADFQHVLLERLSNTCKIYCNKRLNSYTQPSLSSSSSSSTNTPVKLLFEDGTTATCDILVGADGLKSAVRKSMMREKAEEAQVEGRRADAANCLASMEPVWSGTNSYRALIPAESLKKRWPGHRVLTQPTQYLGKGAYIIAYPISKGTLINFAAFLAQHDKENTKFDEEWVTVTGREEVRNRFLGWEPEVQALIECVSNPLRWAIHTVRPLSTFVYGHVAVLGDAAHAMTPHQGSGAGQAIEDAFVLSTILGNPKINTSNYSSLQNALKIYDIVRRPRAQHIHEGSRQNGRSFTLTQSPPSNRFSRILYRNNGEIMDFDKLQREKGTDKMREELVKVLEQIKKRWEWAWTSSVQDEYDEAVGLIQNI